MPRDYQAMTTLVTTKLQSAGSVDYSVAEVNYQIEESLKEIATYKPHIVSLPFKIESRYGVDATGTADKLTDLVKLQFLATDVTNQKVVHNITDNTWAVVTAHTSSSILGISDDIMDAGEAYEIYNKKCTNKRQIYIGDILPEVLDIESVEYPLGTKRNWSIVSNGVLEIDVNSVADSNANTAIVSSLPNVDVWVRVKRRHILSNMTDWAGAISATSGVKAATTVSVVGLAASAEVVSGMEFNVATHRQDYVITGSAMANSAGEMTIQFYPPFEAAAASASVVTFVKSTLKPGEEEIFADLAAARLAINKSPKYFNAISLGGGVVYQNYLNWGERRLGETLNKLSMRSTPKTKEMYPRD